MSEESEAQTCHVPRCDDQAEFLLYLPEWGESRQVCRKELRKVGDGVDATTVLKAGYAKAIDTPGDVPRDPAPFYEPYRDRLEDKMGWADAQ